eukprot:scaffold4677_cov157-Skeletonema_menzelii.AAC.2
MENSLNRRKESSRHKAASATESISSSWVDSLEWLKARSPTVRAVTCSCLEIEVAKAEMTKMIVRRALKR